jgi:hypothetical protein
MSTDPEVDPSEEPGTSSVDPSEDPEDGLESVDPSEGPANLVDPSEGPGSVRVDPSEGPRSASGGTHAGGRPPEAGKGINPVQHSE